MLALPEELQKGFALPAALSKIKAMPSRRGNLFRASGPFAPASRGKRAEKATCDFADVTVLGLVLGVGRLRRRNLADW